MKKGISVKMAILLLVGALLIGGTVGGTVAWLVAESNEVENTFTVGNITLTLSETWNTDGDDADNTPDKWVGKIVPGSTQTKDPKLTVGAGSEQCYVYVLIDNGMVIGDTTVVTSNINTTDWKAIGTSDTKTLYRYRDTVNASTSDVNVPVFTQITYAGTILASDMAGLQTKKITIKGYAHQSLNTSQDTADAAAKNWAGITTTGQ